jgi:sugar lactone lactonase YvrE
MTTTDSVNAVILVDKRVFNYQTIIDSLRDDVRYILYDVDDRTYETMVDYVKAKFSELNVTSFTTIGVVEYNTNLNYYRLFGNSSPDALITGVIWTDPSLETWSYINDFIVWLKTSYAVQHFDFLACSLYINMSWKYIIDTLSTTTGVQIRASTDKTGSSTLGGDWILESTGTDIDMREIYFNETIENFDGVLDLGASITNTIPDPLNPATPTIPFYNSGQGEFTYPRFCKIYNNSLYVVDQQNYRVQIFDTSFNYISQLKFGIAITDFVLNTTTGMYYVISHPIGRVYDANNNLLFTIGGLSYPRAMAIDSSGNIYISEGFRIRRFDPSGNSLGDFMNNQGSGDGQISNATTMTFDASGNFWLTDEGAFNSVNNHRVQKFTSTGTFLMKFGSGGTDNGQFRIPNGIAFDSSGNIYVGDFTNDRIQVFDSSGTFLRIIGNGSGIANGALDGPMDVAVDSNNNVYVVENQNHRLQKFTSSGTYLIKVGYLTNTNSSLTGAFNTPLDVQMFPSNGNFYVVDAGNHRVQKFNSSNVFVLTFGSLGSGNSQFNSPQRLAIDASENIYVSDMNNHVVKVFNSSGTYLRRVGTGSSGSATGQFNSPRGVAVDSAFNLYVTDNNTRIQKFNSSGTFTASYAIAQNAWGLAVDTSGNMYVTGVAEVYKYSPSGTILITMTNLTPWFVGINVRGISVDPLTNNFAIVNQAGAPFLKIYNSSGSRLLATNATTTTSNGGSIGIGPGSGMFYYNNTLFIAQEFGAIVYKASLEELLLTSSLASSTFTVAGLKTGSDAPFAITTRPTSNNSGTPITYTSNNTSVATIAADGSGNAITIVGTGIVTFTASQAATATYYAASITSNALTVTLATSTFASSTFQVASGKNVGDASFAIITRPTSDSNGAITYASNNPSVATITPDGSGNAISLVAIGDVTFTATQAATSRFAGSTRTSNQLTVSLGNPSIITSFTVSGGKAYGDASFAILTRPTTNSSGAITYTSNNTAVATIDASGNWINIVGVGDVSFNAVQAAVPNQFSSRTFTSNTLTVSLGTPTLSSSTFTVANTSKVYGDASFTILTRPTSNSSGAITYTSNNTAVATIDASGDWINIVGAGDVTFTASQAAVPNQFSSGSLTSGTLTVSLATPTISSSTFSVSSSKTFGDASFAILTRPISNSSGAITYTSNNMAVATIDASGDWINIVGAGDVTFTASQAAVPNQFSSGSLTSGTLTISKATPTLAFVSPPSTKFITDASFSVSATSASDGAVLYLSSDISLATVHPTSGIVILKGVGTVIITASQASTSNYNSPSNTTCSISIQSAGTSLQGTTVTSGTSFAELDLSGASLVGTTISGVSFSGANLSNVDFSGAVITGTDFTNVNLSGAMNLPAFSTVQKLQILKNINNNDISEVQVTELLSGSIINSLVEIPSDIINNATFIVAPPSSVDGSGNKVVTVSISDISGNLSIYIPLNPTESVKINNSVYLFDGTNILDADGNAVNFITISGVPFKVYAGSIVAVNVMNEFNKIVITFPDGLKFGLYDLITELFVLK